jgi:hypothetical protein
MATTANNLKPRRLIFSKEEEITTSNPTSYSFTPSSYSTVSINIYKYNMMVTLFTDDDTSHIWKS